MKNYSILDILRGDYREICDDKKPNNKKRQKSKLNEKDKNSQYFEETILSIDTNIMELKNDKIEFDKYNDIIINNSEPKSETIQIKNEKDSFRRNNTDKNLYFIYSSNCGKYELEYIIVLKNIVLHIQFYQAKFLFLYHLVNLLILW